MTVSGKRRVFAAGRGPIFSKRERSLNTAKSAQHMTDQEFAYEIIGIFVKAIGKGIIKGLDFLPREVFRESLKGEFARDHLKDNAAERPQIRAVERRVRSQ